MPDLAKQIERFLEELGRANVSAHTLRNYGSDLEQFLRYFTVKEKTCATTEEIDGLAIREWLGHLGNCNVRVCASGDAYSERQRHAVHWR